MLNLKRYPKSGALTPKRGLNLADNLFETTPDQATMLKNLVFVRDSLLQRRPFWPLTATNYASSFRAAHDYGSPSGARLVFYTADGKIQEIDQAGVENIRVSGLSLDVDGSFSTGFDSVFFANGFDGLKVGKDAAWRDAGSPAAVANLAGTAGVGTLAAGTYLYIVVPVIDVDGIARVFSNWSNLFKITVSALASTSLTWTDVVDARVTRYLVFRTEADGTDLRSLAAVAPGVQTYSDTGAIAVPAVVTGGPDRPAPLNSWGVPPNARIVTYSGNRLVLGGLEDLENAFITSRVAANAYDCEGFPDVAPTHPDSTILILPKDGALTAVFAIGETGEQSSRSTGLFVSQESACYVLPETNTDLPLIEISGSIGAISQRAIAQDGPALFFQSRRGVEYWPGQGREIYLISEKVQPIFTGGGNQLLTGNQGDGNIRYTIAKNQLWISVRDDLTVGFPNKVYCLDLSLFRRGFDPTSPTASTRFSGPIMNTGLSFGVMLRRLNGDLLNFDSLNSRVLRYDERQQQDQVAGVNTSMEVRVQTGAYMREDAIVQKVLKYCHLLMFTGSQMRLRLDFEFGRKILDYDGEFQVNTYPIAWGDIDWEDITWGSDAWYQELPLGFSEASGKWFTATISKTDARADFAYFGLIFWTWPFAQIRTLG